MSTWTAAEQAAHRAELVADLRTEGLRQATGALVRKAGVLDPDRSDGFCCLGRGCEVAAKHGVTHRAPGEGPLDSARGYSTTETLDIGGFVYENGYLPKQVQEFYGFDDIRGRLKVRVMDVAGSTYHYLSELNDGALWTFAQIADLIEADGVHLELEA